MSTSKRVAILIDADNVDADQIAFAVEQAGQRGTITVRRAFGRLSSLKGCEAFLAALGFGAEVALPATTKIKDTTDLLIAQYAARLAERRAVDMVALVSSDSDFATIARGVAESGVDVHGYGKAAAPAALRNACASFIAFPEAPPATAAETVPDNKPSGADFRQMKKLIDDSSNADDQGRVRVQTLGATFKNEFGSDYLTRFGEKNLSSLLRLIDGFELDGEGTGMTIARARARGQ